MTIHDLLEETKISITSNGARTGLTVLGIVIGIASVIVMLAIGNGAQASISSSINALGSNILTVTGGGGNRQGGISFGRGGQQTLTLDDVTAIKEKISLAKDVSPELRSRVQVIASANNTNTQANGVLPSYQTAHSVDLDDGMFFTEEQQRSGAKVAILGPTTRDDLFGIGATDVVGSTIRINNAKFTIIGITKSKGGSGLGNTDDEVFIPLTTAQRYISGTQFVSTISVTTENQSDLLQMQSDITDLLLQRHHKDTTTADFSVMNQVDLASTAQSITQIFTILLSSIASISLLVGGIGIMNMMLTNVRERTREIGLRKAIGAKKKDISNQFLVESIIITILGGVIGVALGLLISYGISSLGVLQTKVTLGPVLLAFGVSACIGIIFGYYPAKKASELNPIEALRYE